MCYEIECSIADPVYLSHIYIITHDSKQLPGMATLPINPMAWPPPVPTMTTLLFFCTASAIWLVLYILSIASRSTVAQAVPDQQKQSKTLTSTLPSIRAMLRHLAELGVILLLCWLAEHQPLFAPSTKHPTIYGFTLLLLLILGASLWSLRKNPSDTAPLNRAQSEEWKGWMQIIFLLYHYLHQGELYKPVRIFIACYVWMTGFGNFSFFYLKGDFGLPRLVSMLWRLNFLVFWLCMTMDNSLILYYINPLHTFYFLLMWTVMRIGAARNREPGFVRLKLCALAAVIFVVWELDLAPLVGFRSVWGPLLEDTAVVGAKSGAYHEWHFRTSLDHWAAFCGACFAFNFPVFKSWIEDENNLGGRTVKVLVAIALIAATCGWAYCALPLPKLEFNAIHPYLSFIPILTYIFLRNATKQLRSWHCVLLSTMGTYTLETYLLQHHLWLSSNAKSLLVLIPQSYYLNAVVVSALFLFLSRRAFTITLALRSMLVPRDTRAVVQSIVAMVAVLLFVHTSAALLCSTRASAPMVALVIALFTLAGLVLVAHETEGSTLVLSKGAVIGVLGALATVCVLEKEDQRFHSPRSHSHCFCILFLLLHSIADLSSLLAHRRRWMWLCCPQLASHRSPLATLRAYAAVAWATR